MKGELGIEIGEPDDGAILWYPPTRTLAALVELRRLRLAGRPAIIRWRPMV